MHNFCLYAIHTYHTLNHDDFRSDILRNEERLHEPQIAAQQRQTVEYPCPHKLAIRESEPQYDGNDEHHVDKQIELVPHALEIAGDLVEERVLVSHADLWIEIEEI